MWITSCAHRLEHVVSLLEHMLERVFLHGLKFVNLLGENLLLPRLSDVHERAKNRAAHAACYLIKSLQVFSRDALGSLNVGNALDVGLAHRE